MANEELSIKIGADTKDLNKALKSAQTELGKFKDKVTPTADGLDKASGKSLAAASSIRNLTGALKGGDASLASVAESALDAGDALLDVKSSANSTQKATSGLSGAMSGPLAIALLTAAVALAKYVFRLSDAAKESQKLVDATKKLVGSAKQELATYNSLLEVAKDETRSKEERLRALTKVNEQSGKYIGNLELEGINSEKTAGLTDKYSQALLQNAKIKGLQSRLSDLYAQQFDIENRQLEQNTKWYEKATASAIAYAGGAATLNAETLIAVQGAKNQAKELAGVNDQITKLTASLTDLTGKDVSEGGIFSAAKKITEGGRIKIESIIDPNLLPNLKKTVSFIDGQLVRTGELMKIRASEISGSIIIAPNEAARIAAYQAWLLMQTQNAQAFLTAQAQLDMFNESANEIINGGIADTFSNLGNVIGSALASGGNVLKAGGASLLAGLGNILVDLGKMAIKVGIGIKAVKTALKSLNPAVAIAGGIALIAIGKVFAKGASSLADGGGGGASSSSSGGSFNGVLGGGSRGSSFGGSGGSSSGGSFNNGGGTVVFEIAGQKLVGVLSNTLTRNRALGGSLNITTG